VDDHLAVVMLYARYCNALDSGRFEEYADCLAEDVVFQHSKYVGEGVVGRAKVTEGAVAYRQGMGRKSHRHLQTNVWCALDGDRGVGRCTISYYMTLEGVTSLDMIGASEDEVVRGADGVWRFSRRVITADG
jgi:hypothetical protein